jgi:hypothetical protein
MCPDTGAYVLSYLFNDIICIETVERQWQGNMKVEPLVEGELAGEMAILAENLPQCHCGHHKSHVTWPGIESEPATNDQSYGAVYETYKVL